MEPASASSRSLAKRVSSQSALCPVGPTDPVTPPKVNANVSACGPERNAMFAPAPTNVMATDSVPLEVPVIVILAGFVKTALSINVISHARKEHATEKLENASAKQDISQRTVARKGVWARVSRVQTISVSVDQQQQNRSVTMKLENVSARRVCR